MPPPEKLYIYEIEGRVSAAAGTHRGGLPGRWREGGYTYLFFSTPREQRVRAWLTARAPGAIPRRPCSITPTGRRASPQAHLAGRLPPLPGVGGAGRRRPGETVIRLEPGLAFGSGYHPTTRRCLTPAAPGLATERPPPGAGPGHRHRHPVPGPWPWAPSGWWRWNITSWRCAPRPATSSTTPGSRRSC